MLIEMHLTKKLNQYLNEHISIKIYVILECKQWLRSVEKAVCA